MIPSSLTFHRVTTSFVDDYDTIMAEELTRGKAERPDLTMQPYAVGEVPTSLPQFKELLKLRDAIADSSGRSALREFWSLLFADEHEARRAYRRWRKIRSDTEPITLERVDGAIQCLVQRAIDPELPFGPDGRTPIGDALTLLEAS